MPKQSEKEGGVAVDSIRSLIQSATAAALSPWTGDDDEARDRSADAVADAVLDALGLEQVGWLHGPFDQFSRMHEVNPHAPGWRGDCSPVYRLRPSGRGSNDG